MIAHQPGHVLIADPPWPFGDKLPGKGRGATKHYDLLSMKDICEFKLPPIHEDCLLYTSPSPRD